MLYQYYSVHNEKLTFPEISKSTGLSIRTVRNCTKILLLLKAVSIQSRDPNRHGGAVRVSVVPMTKANVNKLLSNKEAIAETKLFRNWIYKSSNEVYHKRRLDK